MYDEICTCQNNLPPKFQSTVLKSLFVFKALFQKCLKLFISLCNLFLNATDNLFRQMCIQSLPFLSHRIELALPITDRVQKVLFRAIKVIENICYYSKTLLHGSINYNSDLRKWSKRRKTEPKGRRPLTRLE